MESSAATFTPRNAGPLPEIVESRRWFAHCRACGSLLPYNVDDIDKARCRDCLRDQISESEGEIVLERVSGPPPRCFETCSDCRRELTHNVAETVEPLCNRCLSLEFVATAEILRESTPRNVRPFGLGFCEIPSSEITQSLNVPPPRLGAAVFILLSALVSVAIGGVVLGVAYLSA